MVNNKEPICPYAGQQYSQPQDGEISLLDVWNVLWAQRLLIGAITIIVACLSLVFAFLSKEIYVAKVEITPSKDFETQIVQELKGFTYDIRLPSTNDVFSGFYNDLNNIDVQSQFWEEIVHTGKLMGEKAPQTLNRVSKQNFTHNLDFKVPKGKSIYNQQFTVFLSGDNSEITAELLNKFVSYVNELSVRDLVDNIVVQLQARKEIIEDDIEIQRNLNKKKELVTIAELSEAIIIAEKLGLHNLTNNVAGLPLYARGVKALQIEKDVLQKREKVEELNEDLFVLESKLANLSKILSKINFDKNNISTIQANYSPPQKKNQKPLFILFFGIIAGFVFAVFMAFLKNFLQQTKINCGIK